MVTAIAVLGRTGAAIAFILDVAWATARPPYGLRELLRQIWFLGSVTLVPGLLVAAATGVIAGAQAHAVVRTSGLVLPLGVAAPVVAALVVAATGGPAACAELRGFALDAMVALGVDPVERLTPPRILAMGVVAALLTAASSTALALGAAAAAGEPPAIVAPTGVPAGFGLGLAVGLVAVRVGLSPIGSAAAAVVRTVRASALTVLAAAAAALLLRGVPW